MISKNMIKTIIGFAIIFFILFLAWFIRDLVVSTFIFPIILGTVQLAKIINSFPQIVWWILLILISCSLFIVNIKLPSILIFRKKEDISVKSRIDVLNNMINDSLNLSRYSGQQLSLLLMNLHLKNMGEKEINSHKLEDLVKMEKVPEELSPFIKVYYKNTIPHRNSAVQRLSLEKAVNFLDRTEKGDPGFERSSE